MAENSSITVSDKAAIASRARGSGLGAGVLSRTNLSANGAKFAGSRLAIFGVKVGNSDTIRRSFISAQDFQNVTPR